MNFKNSIFFKKCINIFRYVGITYIIFFIPSVLGINSKLKTINLKSHSYHIINNAHFKDNNEKTSYSLGVSFGSYIEHALMQQKKLGFFLNKKQFISGIKDTILGKLKLSNEDIAHRLNKLEKKLKRTEIMILKKQAKENNIQGKLYISNFIKKTGVKKTNTGLCILVKKLGNGDHPKTDDMILVNYKGTLIDGSQFDNSYSNGPIWLSIKNIIPGWQEGIKYIKKGGEITLVIPPHLAYGENGVPGIPSNSTLIFDIELIDIKSALK